MLKKSGLIVILALLLVSSAYGAVVSHRSEDIRAGTFGDNVTPSGNYSFMGRVGIGTETPEHPIHVNGDLAGNMLRIGQYGGPGGIFHEDSNTSYIELDAGTAWGSGSAIQLFGRDSTSADIIPLNSSIRMYYGSYYENEDKGYFMLMRSKDSANTPVLTATPDMNVGIGSTTPSQKLHVEGNMNVTGTIYGDGSGLTGLPAGGQWTDAGSYIYANNNDSVVVTDDGKVGIGTSSPEYKLDINSEPTLGIRINSTYPLIDFSENDVEEWGAFWRMVLDNKVLRFDFANNSVYSNYISSMSMNYNGDIHFPNGNVGIGTIDPRAELTVVDNVADTSFTGPELGAGHIQTGAAVGNWANIDFGVGGSYIDLPLARIGAKYTSAGTYLSLGTSNNYGSGITNQALTIDPSGNVGIGTDSPLQKLHVLDGDMGIAFQKYNPGDGDALRIVGYNGTNYNPVYIDTNGAANLYVGTSGNVGIGTSSPAQKLDVNGGSLRVTSSNSGIQRSIASGNNISSLVLRYSGGNSDEINGMPASGGSINFEGPYHTEGYEQNFASIRGFKEELDASTNGAIAFFTNNGSDIEEQMRIDSDGNVGIGTSSPSSKLDVAGNINATGDICITGGNCLSSVSGLALERTVFQTGHGFEEGNVLYYNGTEYLKAMSDSEETLGMFVVSENVSDDSFKIISSGYLDSLAGFSAGEYYYVSDSTPGMLTTSEGSSFSNPIFFALSSSSGYVLPWRPSTSGIGSSGNVDVGESNTICNSTYRGELRFVESGSGVDDYLYSCMKNSTDQYNWVMVSRGG